MEYTYSFYNQKLTFSLINMLIISWQIYAHCIASRIKTFTQYNTERSGHVSEALIRETYRWLWLEGQASQEGWVEEILQGVIQFPEHHAGVINDIIYTCNGDHSCHSKLIPATNICPFNRSKAKNLIFQFISKKILLKINCSMQVFYFTLLKNLKKGKYSI